MKEFMKMTIQIAGDKGVFDKIDDADEILEKYLLIHEVNDRRRPESDEINDDIVIQWFYSQRRFEKKETSKRKIRISFHLCI